MSISVILLALSSVTTCQPGGGVGDGGGVYTALSCKMLVFHDSDHLAIVTNFSNVIHKVNDVAKNGNANRHCLFRQSTRLSNAWLLPFDGL